MKLKYKPKIKTTIVDETKFEEREDLNNYIDIGTRIVDYLQKYTVMGINDILFERKENQYNISISVPKYIMIEDVSINEVLPQFVNGMGYIFESGEDFALIMRRKLQADILNNWYTYELSCSTLNPPNFDLSVYTRDEIWRDEQVRGCKTNITIRKGADAGGD